MAGLEPAALAALEARLGAMLTEAQRAWPGVSVPAASFLDYLAARLPPDQEPAAALGETRAADLYLACACARGEPAALAAFDAAYRGEMERAMGRIQPAGLAPDDLRQLVREKLFVGDDRRPARITDYAGRGSLRGWVRVVVVRTLLDLAREHNPLRQETGHEPLLELPAEPADPELAYLKQRYQGEFKQAFEQALRALPPQGRNLLRLQLVDGLSIDEIGEVYGVHRATAARRLAAAREALALATRDRLAERLRIAGRDLDSILRLVHSQLEITLQRVLVTTEEPPASDQKK